MSIQILSLIRVLYEYSGLEKECHHKRIPRLNQN